MSEVRFLARARADVLRIDTWWRENRPAAPNLFREELTRAVSFLEDRPELSAVFGHRRGETVRRVVLPECRAHAYYVLRNDCVLILRVWGGARGRPPSLR